MKKFLCFLLCVIFFGSCNQEGSQPPVIIQEKPFLSLDPIVYNQDSVVISGNYKVTSGDSIGSVITIINAKYVKISGKFDGGNRKFFEYFHIEGDHGKVYIDTLEFKNCQYHGMGIWSKDPLKQGFDTIKINKFIEKDGIGQSMPGGDYEIYALRIRGAHKFILIKEIEVENYKSKWATQDTLPHYNSVSITCEVDASNFPRPDSVFIDKINIKYGFGCVSLNGITNFRINSIVMDSLFRRPDQPDEKAYANNTYRAVNLCKYGWSAFRVSESHTSFGSVVVKNSNPYWQKYGFVIPFFISNDMGTPSIDSLITDMLCILTGAKINYLELGIPMQNTPSEWMQLHQNQINTLKFNEKNTIFTFIASTTTVKDTIGTTPNLIK
jgi:hypothetical protein